jgi:hypothetical protein
MLSFDLIGVSSRPNTAETGRRDRKHAATSRQREREQEDPVRLG